MRYASSPAPTVPTQQAALQTHSAHWLLWKPITPVHRTKTKFIVDLGLPANRNTLMQSTTNTEEEAPRWSIMKLKRFRRFPRRSPGK